MSLVYVDTVDAIDLRIGAFIERRQILNEWVQVEGAKLVLPPQPADPGVRFLEVTDVNSSPVDGALVTVSTDHGDFVCSADLPVTVYRKA